MILYFGLQFDNPVYRDRMPFEGGKLILGPQQLLQALEKYTGLSGPSNNIKYLRVEKFRQAILRFLKTETAGFFTPSFHADQIGTSETLLEMRDELVINGWQFQPTDNTPARLRTLARLEEEYTKLLKEEKLTSILLGYADRFRLVLRALSDHHLPFQKVYIYEPLELLPSNFKTLFKKLSDTGVQIEQLPQPKQQLTDTDLGKFQQLLLGKTPKNPIFKADGSLQLITAQRESEATAFFPRLLKDNDAFNPVCLIPEQNRTLDYALLQIGMPAMGIQSTSHARPILQILKLVPAFIWTPVDPFKLLEFVSLPYKPLEPKLARVIARLLSSKPGLKSDKWDADINQYFNWAHAEGIKRKDFSVQTIQFQYQLWFERPRYPKDQKVPRSEMITIFSYISQWALESYENDDAKKSTFLVLSEQAKRIEEILESLPEEESKVDQLTLERIIRSIYEPSPVQFNDTQVGFTDFFHHPGAMIQEAPQTVWWNFIRMDTEDQFSRWFNTEIKYLASKNIILTTATVANQLELWQSYQPILRTQDQLILVIPKKIEGEEVFPHALFDLLEAHFKNLDAISTPIEKCQSLGLLKKEFQLPLKSEIKATESAPTTPILKISSSNHLKLDDTESLTSLETLIYYPYKWFFKRQAQLKKSPILSIVRERTLLGNLAHRFFENLLKKDFQQWDQSEMMEWIDHFAIELLEKEGVVFQMYGREPERVAFLNKVKQAAWMLTRVIIANGWKVVGTEELLEGEFMDIPIKGYADLILKRGNEYCVVDLKWRGTNRRKALLKNREDLQLVLYAHLLHKNPWPHTAFFIIEETTLIARNQQAFKESIVEDFADDHQEVCKEILDKMEKTIAWRIQQLTSGQLEIRTEDTCRALDELYGGSIMELLELKSDNAPFDDYETLVR